MHVQFHQRPTSFLLRRTDGRPINDYQHIKQNRKGNHLCVYDQREPTGRRNPTGGVLCSLTYSNPLYLVASASRRAEIHPACLPVCLYALCTCLPDLCDCTAHPPAAPGRCQSAASSVYFTCPPFSSAPFRHR